MFKAVICDESREYCFPFIPEKYLAIKMGVLVILLGMFISLLLKPLVPPAEVVFVLENIKIAERIDEFGMTRLHRAVVNGNRSGVNLLLRNGVEVDKTDKYGWSSLHWATFMGRDDIIDILISNGARRDLRSTEDWFSFKKGSLPGDVKRSF